MSSLATIMRCCALSMVMSRPAIAGVAVAIAAANSTSSMARPIMSLPRAIGDAGRRDAALQRLDLGPRELAAVLGDALAIIRRHVEIGVGVIGRGADRDCGQRAERRVSAPAVAVAVPPRPAAPVRIVAAAIAPLAAVVPSARPRAGEGL